MDFLPTNSSDMEDLPILSSNMELVEKFGVQSPNQSVWQWAEMLQNRSIQTQSDRSLIITKEILRNMRTYYTPSVVVFGILGNTIIWIMLICSKLRTLSCTHYMAAMVIVNTVHLVALLLQWLTLFGIDLYNTPGVCQFVSFINSVCVFLSIWFVVGFAVDRYIANAHPQHTPVMCTTLKAKVVIIALSLVGFVVYMNISLTVGVINLKGKPRCSPLPMFLRNLRILTMFDMLINIIIPYTTIIGLDIILMRYHWAELHKPVITGTLPRSPSMEDVRDVTSESNNNNDSDLSDTRGWRRERIRTNNYFADQMNSPMRKFAIIYLTFFLLTHLPSEAFRLVHTTRGLVDPFYFGSRWGYYLQVFSQHMFNTSLASHLWLFLLFHKFFNDWVMSFAMACMHKLRLSYLVVKTSQNDLQMNSNEIVGGDIQHDSHDSLVSMTFV